MSIAYLLNTYFARYVLSASHCFCTRLTPCNTTNIEMHTRPRSVIDICIGVKTKENCKQEKKAHLSYEAVRIIIPTEKLKIQTKHNYDIALVELDREVHLSTEMGPICLDAGPLSNPSNPLDTPTLLGSLAHQKANAAYISGFGITFYRNKAIKDKVPECSTNQFLPRPFHSKSSNFNYNSHFYLPSLQ